MSEYPMSPKSPDPNRQSALTVILGMLIGLQGIAAIILLFVPSGFDHPSAWGLDFDGLVIIVRLYFLTLLAGVFLSAVNKRWEICLVQVLPGLLICCLFWSAVFPY